MTFTELLLYGLLLQVLHFVGTWKLYKRAGVPIWQALVPFYSFWQLMKITGRPAWWSVFLWIPGVNCLMLIILWFSILRSFGYAERRHVWMTILSLGLYIFYLNYTADLKAYNPANGNKARNGFEEWLGSVLYAIIVATLVHTYIMQPYIIPTSSLEKSLLVGDFLFVSKFHYGSRVPTTLVAAPMVHDTLPLLKIRSYLKKPQLPSLRLPAIQKIKRNEIVVFNWPADTVQQFFKTPDRKIIKPVDKKSNYVKRCVAIAGDTLEIINGDVYINGEKSQMPDRAKPQFYYEVTMKKGQKLNAYLIYDKYQVRKGEGYSQNGNYLLNMDEANARNIAKDSRVASVKRKIRAKEEVDNVFPQSLHRWNIDHYGPIYIPKKGATIDLNTDNLPFYKRLITEYEHHQLKVEGDKIYIDGVPTTTYTFAQNYYWMMGDNRHNSEDSRFWGYVPFDHIVGKPVFIWMSFDFDAKGLDKVRWERFFTTVHGEGKPISYLYYFLGALLIYWGYRKYRKRKKATAL